MNGSAFPIAAPPPSAQGEHVYNVPGLFFMWDDEEGRFHIARTNIAGCRAECGYRLCDGQDYRRDVPPRNVICKDCHHLITHLEHPR